MFFNMKIEVNEDQSLDEIVSELERLGYENKLTDMFDKVWICAGYNKFIGASFSNRNNMPSLWGDLTTLAELKEINND